MDYVCSMNNEWPYVLGLEKMLDIKVPEKVEYVRVIMAELNRIANHQIAIATFGLDSGAFTPFLYFFRDREMILTMFEKASGGRLLYNYFWVGGLAADVHPTFKEDVTEIIRIIRDTNAEILDLLLNNKIFIDRNANVGILPADVAINYGVTGPVLRASGIPLDLRRSEPYSIYERQNRQSRHRHPQTGDPGRLWRLVPDRSDHDPSWRTDRQVGASAGRVQEEQFARVDHHHHLHLR